MEKPDLNQLAKAIIDKLPLSLLTLLVISVFAILLYKLLRSDEGSFLGFRWKNDRRIKETLSGSSSKLHTLERLLPTFTLLNNELATVTQMVRQDPVGAHRRLRKLYDVLLEGLAHVLEEDSYLRPSIVFPSSNNGDLYLAWAPRHPAAAVGDRKFPPGSGAWRAFTTGDDYHCQDTQKDGSFERNKRSRHQYLSYVCIPINKDNGEVLGVLQVDATKPRAFSPDDLKTLDAFTGFAATLRQLDLMLQLGAEEVAVSDQERQTLGRTSQERLPRR